MKLISWNLFSVYDPTYTTTTLLKICISHQILSFPFMDNKMQVLSSLITLEFLIHTWQNDWNL